jgi:hypothetical protein
MHRQGLHQIIPQQQQQPPPPPSQTPPARLDNSPRYQNFYTEAESRYSTHQAQEYHRRYQALAEQQMQRGGTPPTPPAPHERAHPPPLAPLPAAVLRPDRIVSEAERRQLRQLEMQQQALLMQTRGGAVTSGGGGETQQQQQNNHFTPPSLRPELRAAAVAAAGVGSGGGGAGSLQQPFQFNALGRGAAAAAIGRLQTTAAGAAAQLGRERFQDMMRQLSEVGDGSYSEGGDGARTPPGRAMSPVRPEFSPLSDW